MLGRHSFGYKPMPGKSFPLVLQKEIIGMILLRKKRKKGGGEDVIPVGE